MITVNPDIHKIVRTSAHNYLFLACDGIWDCMSSQAGIDFVNNHFKNAEDKRHSKCVEDMFDSILATDVGSSGKFKDRNFLGGIGCDNMTAIVI